MFEVGDPKRFLEPFARTIHPTNGKLQPIEKSVDFQPEIKPLGSPFK